MWYLNYLGIKHDYSSINCFTLIKQIYREQLKFNDFDNLCYKAGVPNGTPFNRRWQFKISLSEIECHAVKFFKKVNLTDIGEFDLIVFKSDKDRPNHFGIYIKDNKFLHLEEGKFSILSELDDKYRNSIASIWRLNGNDI